MKREAGKSRSRSGTTGERSSSAQTGAFITQAWCCSTNASTATAMPQPMRTLRRSGVVFGSEIMKKVKRMRLPTSS